MQNNESGRGVLLKLKFQMYVKNKHEPYLKKHKTPKYYRGFILPYLTIILSLSCTKHPQAYP